MIAKAVRFAALIGLTLVFIACSEKDNLKSIAGFWVTSDYKNNKQFYTLCITDSVVETNKYGIDNYEYAIMQMEDYFDVHHPFDSWPLAFQLFLKGDTLVQAYPNEGGESRKRFYVRTDSIGIKKDLLFCDSPLSIQLPEADHRSNDWLSMERPSLVSNLYIGYLKKGNLQDFPGMEPDSLGILVEDVLINLSDIDLFIIRSMDTVDESEREKIIIALAADKATSRVTIEEIVRTVHLCNPNLIMCRAYFDVTIGKIRYKALSKS